MLFKFLLLCVAVSSAMGAASNGLLRFANIPAAWSSLSDNALTDKDSWTAYLNMDKSMTYGTGDFEGINKALRKNTAAKCQLWCQEPVAVQWQVVDQALNKTLVDKCLRLDLSKIGGAHSSGSSVYPGYNCLDSAQADDAQQCSQVECDSIGMLKSKKRELKCDHCVDMKVRYLCETNQNGAACPGTKQTRSLIEELAEQDEQVEKRAMEVEELEARAITANKRDMDEKTPNSLQEVENLLRALLTREE